MALLLTMRQQAAGTAVHPGSLQFSMEVVEDAQRSRQKAVKQEEDVQAQRALKALLLQGLGAFGEQLLQDAEVSSRVLAREAASGDVDTWDLGAKLASLGYNVRVREGTPGGSTGASSAPGSCFRNLRHVFLQVLAPSGTEYAGAEFLVDPHFREQFTVSHPTDDYKALLQLVPAVFVGMNARLVQIVTLMCSEMARSFEETQLTLPPWRRPQAMLSKWLPVKAKDIPVPPCSSSGSSHAGSPQGTSPAGASPVRSTSSSPASRRNLYAGNEGRKPQQPGTGAPTVPAFTVPAWLQEQQRRREEESVMRDLQIQFANLAAHNQQQASPSQALDMGASPVSPAVPLLFDAAQQQPQPQWPVLGFEADPFKRTSMPPIASAAWQGNQGFGRRSEPLVGPARPQQPPSNVSLLSAQLGFVMAQAQGARQGTAGPAHAVMAAHPHGSATAVVSVVPVVPGTPTNMTIHKVRYQQQPNC